MRLHIIDMGWLHIIQDMMVTIQDYRMPKYILHQTWSCYCANTHGTLQRASFHLRIEASRVFFFN